MSLTDDIPLPDPALYWRVAAWPDTDTPNRWHVKAHPVILLPGGTMHQRTMSQPRILTLLSTPDQELALQVSREMHTRLLVAQTLLGGCPV